MINTPLQIFLAKKKLNSVSYVRAGIHHTSDKRLKWVDNKTEATSHDFLIAELVVHACPMHLVKDNKCTCVTDWELCKFAINAATSSFSVNNLPIVLKREKVHVTCWILFSVTGHHHNGVMMSLNCDL